MGTTVLRDPVFEELSGSGGINQTPDFFLTTQKKPDKIKLSKIINSCTTGKECLCALPDACSYPSAVCVTLQMATSNMDYLVKYFPPQRNVSLYRILVRRQLLEWFQPCNTSVRADVQNTGTELQDKGECSRSSKSCRIC